MHDEVLTVIVGALSGGIVGLLAGFVTSYYGPRRLEEWRQQRAEEKLNAPRKELLRKMLEDEQWSDGRKLETLSRVIGATEAECRSLLIEIGARGVTLEGDVEGWALISRKPLTEQ